MDWIALAQTNGIPFACLAAVGYGLWKGASWFGVNVLKPATEAHIEYLKENTHAIRELHSKHDSLHVKQDRVIDLLTQKGG